MIAAPSPESIAPALPLAQRSPANAASSNAVVVLDGAPSTAAALRKTASEFGVSPSDVVTAAVIATLHRYGGEGRVLVAHGRAFAVPFDLVDVAVADGSTFGRLVAQCADFHAVAPTGIPGAANIALRCGDDGTGDEAVTELVRASGAAVAVDAFVSNARFALRVAYDAATYEETVLLRFARHLEQLLDAGTAQPDVPIERLAFLTDNERETHARWNATAADVDLGHDLVDAFRDTAQRFADRVAVQCDDTALTYAELHQRATRLGATLHDAGIQSEALVAVFVDRSVDMYVAALGIQRAGGAYLPIDPASPAERIAFMLEDARVAAVVTHEGLRERLPSCSARIVSLDDETGEAIDGEPPALPSNPRRLAYTIYTSGSTGRPKGVMVEHGSVVNLLAGVNALIPMDENDTLVALAPLAFDMSVLDVFWPLTRGARIVVASRHDAQNPKALLALMRRSNVTHMQATPSTWRMLVEAGWEGNAGLTLITGGEALPAALADQLLARARTVWNLYGPTETTVWATSHRVARAGEAPTIGTPMANVTTAILDAHGRLVPPGVIGDLYIGGAGLARGYLRRPELSAERFIANPLQPDRADRIYNTGDLARYRADGCIEFFGRSDFQVKLRGYRIELGEVETALARFSGVRAAVATVREDVDGDPRLIGYVACDVGTAIAPGDVRRALLATLPAYMVPDGVVVLERLPCNTNGKIDRAQLPPPPQTRATQQGANTVAARNATEQRLIAIWEDVLDLRPIGVTDDFFALGATSITAARVFERIERELGAVLPLSPLFAAPTIERLARLIASGNVERSVTSLVPIQANGSRRPIFGIHGGAGTILHFHALAKRLGNDQPLYGFQMQGLYGDAAPHASVASMARHYIAEMRSVQPHGPYAIVGYCFGAIVAFEMARRLSSAGEQISLLASVNGPSPAYIRRHGGPSPVARIRLRPPAGIGGRLVFGMKCVWWSLNGELRGNLRTRLFDLRTYAYAKFGRPLPDRWRELAMYRICHVAETRYRVRAYRGAMLVFHADGLYRRDDLGWTPFVRSIATYRVDGRHETQRDAMFEPAVATIADCIRRQLEVADA